jgi:murein L,D-transpeptidase YcbB/YkuD
MRHESGWDEARIQQLTERDRTQYVQLAEPVPIYLVYMTSWVTPNGIVHFRRDVYGADEFAVSLATN